MFEKEIIRIEKKEQIEQRKEMADGIRTAAHGEQRKRNKSQDYCNQHDEK